MTTSLKKTLLASLVVPAIALTAACTGGNDNKTASGDSGGASAPSAAVPQRAAPHESQQDALGSAGSATASRDFSADASLTNAQSAEDVAPESTSEKTTPAQAQAIISKGLLSLHSKDIDKTRFDLQELLDRLNGTIADEQASADKSGRTIRQRLVLRVPSKSFGKAMDGISKLPGVKLVSRNRSSEDVTTQVIDNNTRVRTQRASLARVQALLGRATSLREIISIESQLSRRQADLDSLEAQQKYLADQTSLSTINVYLTVPSKKAAHKKHGHDFFSGFRSGWDQLGSSTNALLTGIGAALPFVFVLALIGFPGWAAWRRRSPRVLSAPTAEA